MSAYGSAGARSLDAYAGTALQGVKAGEGQQMQPLDIPAGYQLSRIEGHRLVEPFRELVWRMVTAIDSGHPTTWDVASFADGVAVQQILDAIRRNSLARLTSAAGLLSMRSSGMRLFVRPKHTRKGVVQSCRARRRYGIIWSQAHNAPRTRASGGIGIRVCLRSICP